MRVTCTNCGQDHPTWDCRAAKRSSPGDNTTLPCRKAGIADGGIRVGQSDTDAASLVVRKELSENRGGETHRVEAPKSKFDKKAYMRLYMAEYRKGKRRRGTLTNPPPSPKPNEGKGP